MTYLLDTDTCIGVLRGQSGVCNRIKQVAPQDCVISTIPSFELLCGIRKARFPQIERAKVARFLSMFIQLPFDREAAEAASIIRMDLQAKGTPIGPYDLLIAGHAMANNCILITGNTAEFERVAGLAIERWI